MCSWIRIRIANAHPDAIGSWIRIRIVNAHPDAIGSWIRIRIANADPYAEGGNQPKKEEKLSQETRKNRKIIIFYAVMQAKNLV
jgi:hypothetical protein